MPEEKTPLDLFGLHHGRALAVARTFASRLPRHVRRDELEQAALLGLWDAVQRFQPGRCAFWTYAYRRVWGSIVDSLREGVARGHRKAGKRPHRHPMAFSQMHRGVNGCRYSELHSELTKGYLFPDHRQPPPDRDIILRDLCERALACLQPRDREAFTGYYLEGLTMAEVGERMGIVYSRVSQRLGGDEPWSARGQMRQQLAGSELD